MYVYRSSAENDKKGFKGESVGDDDVRLVSARHLGITERVCIVDTVHHHYQLWVTSGERNPAEMSDSGA
jgi:hypothetical protein